MAKPTYDDLVFLIAFLWKWGGERVILNALIDEDEEKISHVLEIIPYGRRENREDYDRARKIFWSLKDEITKINEFWG